MSGIDGAFDKVMKMGAEVQQKINDGTITEEEVMKVAQKLEDEIKDDETLNMIRNLPSNNGIATTPAVAVTEPIESKDALTTTDPETGKTTIHGIIGEDYEEKDLDIDFDKYLNMDDYRIDNIEFTAENVEKSSIAMAFELNEEECAQFATVINKYKKDESYPIYRNLPSKLQMAVDHQAVAGGVINSASRNSVAKNMINMVVTDVGSDMYQIDMQRILNNKIESMTGGLIQEAYVDIISNKKEKMYKMADVLDEKGYQEKATVCREIGDAAEESYKLEKFYDAIKNHKIKVKKIEMEKPSRAYDEISNKYHNSTLSINLVDDVPIALGRQMVFTEKPIDGVTHNTIVGFTVLFCKYCRNMNPNNPQEHTFMYYFIKNILALDSTPAGEDNTKFAMDLVNRIKDCLIAVHDVYGF